MTIAIKPGMKLKETKTINFRCYGVAVDKQCVYVCGGDKRDGTGIKVLSLAGEDISFFSHTGSGSPRYICLTDDGTKVCYTAGSGKESTINCFTKDGYGIFSASSKEFKYPRCIVCDKNDNWLICDDEMKTIRIVYSVCVVCNTLITREDEFQPKSLCRDLSEDILVVALWSANSPKLAAYKLNYG